MNNLLRRKRSAPIAIEHTRNPFLAAQRTFERAVEDFYDILNLPEQSKKAFEEIALSPYADIIDAGDSFKVEIEMPGLGEKDVKVSINEGMLTIKGEKSTSKKDKGKNYITREISYGSYERNISLPDTVDVDKATASFKKGMLWVTIPKKAGHAKKNREIKIEKATE